MKTAPASPPLPPGCSWPEVLAHHRRREERAALHRRFGYDGRAAVRFVLDQARPLPERALEIGTGKGNFMVALAREGVRVTTVDINAEEQDAARLAAAYAGVFSRIEFRVADAQALPWREGAFPLVISLNTFHHLPRPDRALAEMWRVLAPGGKLVLADFSATGFQRMAAIHQFEGRRHPTPPNRFAHWEAWLREQGAKTRRTAGRHQEVLVAHAPPAGPGVPGLRLPRAPAGPARPHPPFP